MIEPAVLGGTKTHYFLHVLTKWGLTIESQSIDILGLIERFLGQLSYSGGSIIAIGQCQLPFVNNQTFLTSWYFF